jgi:hypothetical protein
LGITYWMLSRVTELVKPMVSKQSFRKQTICPKYFGLVTFLIVESSLHTWLQKFRVPLLVFKKSTAALKSNLIKFYTLVQFDAHNLEDKGRRRWGRTVEVVRLKQVYCVTERLTSVTIAFREKKMIVQAYSARNENRWVSKLLFNPNTVQSSSIFNLQSIKGDPGSLAARGTLYQNQQPSHRGVCSKCFADLQEISIAGPMDNNVDDHCLTLHSLFLFSFFPPANCNALAVTRGSVRIHCLQTARTVTR